jgi:SAM-dependent MidA family methyltransferase
MRESFRDFMWRALYHPQRGYYSARIGTVGRRGDFSTSATLGGDLARAVARWIKAEAAACEVQTVIEIGSGDGSLMAGVLSQLGWWRRRRLRFVIVECSAPLQLQQQARLGSRRVAWCRSMEEALAECGGRALIFHNEVMDAFPVRLLEWREGWKEVHLAWQEGSAREFLEPAPALSVTDFSPLAWKPTNGQRVEVMEDLHCWLMAWLPHWKQGAMLGIDYGDEFPALFHRRPRGTLRAYLMQQRMEGHDLYANAGRQDLTADVNFTDVRKWLQDAGADEQGFCTQAELLRQLGVSSDPKLAAAYESFHCVWSRRVESKS